MRIDYHKNFDKRFIKLSPKQKAQFKLRLIEFDQNPYNVKLNNHTLTGKYKGYRSINVTGDLRAIFIMRDDKYVEFVYIGSHSQLYK